MPSLGKIVVAIARIVVASVFIFSGFVKSVDPWGTAIKIEEYLAVYSFDWLLPIAMTLSIALCAVELFVGLLLLCNFKIRQSSFVALIFMLGFTIITLLSATIFPVEDCGCFGDAVKLTAWQTFYKNIILLALIAVVFRATKCEKFTFSLRDTSIAILLLVTSLSVGIYSYRHLPIIDFMPYKIGVNLSHEVLEDSNAEEEFATTLVYKNRQSSEIREFEITDIEWHDDTQWEWVETKVTPLSKPSNKSMLAEFAVRDYEGQNRTTELLSYGGSLYMLCVTSISELDGDCLERLGGLTQRAMADGDMVVCLTPQTLSSQYITLADEAVECFNIDASTMKSALRANVGVMELKDGIIVAKSNCRDI